MIGECCYHGYLLPTCDDAKRYALSVIGWYCVCVDDWILIIVYEMVLAPAGSAPAGFGRDPRGTRRIGGLPAGLGNLPAGLGNSPAGFLVRHPRDRHPRDWDRDFRHPRDFPRIPRVHPRDS